MQKYRFYKIKDTSNILHNSKLTSFLATNTLQTTTKPAKISNFTNNKEHHLKENEIDLSVFKINNMEQHNYTTVAHPQSNMVFISPPCLKLDFDKNDYPWHLKTSVECNLDFWDCQKVAKEFQIQSDIENALFSHFSKFCEIKQIAVCHQGNENIHHWYISTEKIKLSIDDILEFDKINVQRAINFELTKDPSWKHAIPILEQMKDKILGLYSVLDQLKEI